MPSVTGTSDGCITGGGVVRRRLLVVKPARSRGTVVAELVPEVVAWNADPRYDISVAAMNDPRVRVVQDDVINLLRANPAAFDAILLDTDNGPDGMLMSESTPLYSARGIESTVAALRTGITSVHTLLDTPERRRRLAGEIWSFAKSLSR